MAAAWADLSHALRSFYDLAIILIVLDEVLCLARQLKFKPETTDDHPVISHLTASLCFWSMELRIIGWKERGESGKAAGVDGVSLDTREWEMAIPDTDAGECHRQGEGNSTSIDKKAGVGIHAESTWAGQKKGVEGEDIRYPK